MSSNDYPKVYAARVKDLETLKNSSSGGVFTALSDCVLHLGGAILSAVYDYTDQSANFRLIQTAEERDAARGSKYVQSNMNDAFRAAQEWLNNNPDKKLLFAGLGCQADAFRMYMKTVGLLNRVWIVDIICHGVPSPQIWKEYITPIHPQWLTFKDKRNGWQHPTAVASAEGKEILLDQYVRVFYQHSVLRPSCFSCPYASLHRSTDITIGDYWGIQNKIPEFFHNMGNQLVLIHNKTGEKLWEALTDVLDICPSNTEDCLQKNLIQPTKMPQTREKFWREWHEKGTEQIILKYGAKKEADLMHKVKNKLKRYLAYLQLGGGKVTSSNAVRYEKRRAA